MANTELQKRKSPRLKGFDYSASRYYFVTICTVEHRSLFGKIVNDSDNGHMILNHQGMVTDRHIQSLNARYETVEVDKYVIMPNHVHMIIEVKNAANVSLIKVISLFKAGVARECKIPIWQRSFHDHIIRGEEDYKNIWKYIDNNPAKWAMDKYYQSVDG